VKKGWRLDIAYVERGSEPLDYSIVLATIT
jgi:hypothetical protein